MGPNAYNLKTCGFLLAAGLLSLLSGCSTADYRELTQSKLKTKKKTYAFSTLQKTSPLSLKVALMPLKTSYLDKEKERKKIEKNNPEIHTVQIEKNKFLQRIQSVLKKANVFQSVDIAQPIDEEELHIKNPTERRKKLLELYLTQAWMKQQDLLLEFDLKEYKLAYKGVSTWRYIFAMFTWFYVWFPSWWIADEKYEAHIILKTKVYSVHSKKLLATYRIEKKHLDYLDDWDRGWKILGIWTVPSYLSNSNWEDINNCTGKYTLNQVWLALIKKFKVDFRRYLRTPEFEDKMKKTLAIVIGLSKYEDTAIPSGVQYGANDARKLAQFLTPKVRRLHLLVDSQASKAKIEELLENFFAKRVRSWDTVVFYFSGFGVALPTDKRDYTLYLVPYRAKVNNLANTAIPVQKLLQAITALPAKHHWIFLDTSFGGTSEGKSLTREVLGIETKWKRVSFDQRNQWKNQFAQQLEKAAQKTFSSLANTTVLLPCHPVQDCLQLHENQQGLFNFFLLKSFSKYTKGRSISFFEAYRYMKRKILSQAKRRNRKKQILQRFYKKFIFDMNYSLKKDLNSGKWTPSLQEVFQLNQISLPANIIVRVIEPNQRWRIHSPDTNQVFIIQAKKENLQVFEEVPLALSYAIPTHSIHHCPKGA